MIKFFYSLLKKIRNRHLLMIDLAIMAITPAIALYLRYEFIEIVERLLVPLSLVTLIFLLIKLAVFHSLHFYSRFWRYASVDEISVLAGATCTAWVLNGIVFYAFLKPAGLIPASFPNSIPIIDGVLTILFVGGLRLALRTAYVMSERGISDVPAQPVLIVGAGVAGSMIVKELRANSHLGMEPVGFLDDDPRKQHMFMHHVKVLGTLADLEKVVKAEKIREVIIAMPTVSGKVIRDVVTACKALHVKSKTIPGVFEMLSGSAVAQLREVSIDDLLRRDIVTIDEGNVAQLIHGARVMVTGAGGSIGSELCRQIAKFHPSELIMLGHGENTIFLIANALKRMQAAEGQEMKLTTVIADIRDRRRMERVMDDMRPQIIFHAAAHKHVGLMEANTPDAVTNNVLGTKIVVELAAKVGVQKLVMISSDKAVNPMCVMGVTKRVAELVVRDAATRLNMPFCIVRFGNVLGSRGSVVPIFKNQIRNGGPVTITHPDVSRFFMTIPEAVRLVLQAGVLGKGGETFVLDMGEPVKIVDLARDLIRLSGLREGVDIDIAYKGLTVGEKMHEELFYGHEHAERSLHAKIWICRNGHARDLAGVMNAHATDDSTHEAFKFNLEHLIAAAQEGDAEYTNELLKKMIPQYSNPVLERSFRKAEAESIGTAAQAEERDENILLKFPHAHTPSDVPAEAPSGEPKA